MHDSRNLWCELTRSRRLYSCRSFKRTCAGAALTWLMWISGILTLNCVTYISWPLGMGLVVLSLSWPSHQPLMWPLHDFLLHWKLCYHWRVSQDWLHLTDIRLPSCCMNHVSPSPKAYLIVRKSLSTHITTFFKIGIKICGSCFFWQSSTFCSLLCNVLFESRLWNSSFFITIAKSSLLAQEHGNWYATLCNKCCLLSEIDRYWPHCSLFGWHPYLQWSLWKRVYSYVLEEITGYSGLPL